MRETISNSSFPYPSELFSSRKNHGAEICVYIFCARMCPTLPYRNLQRSTTSIKNFFLEAEGPPGPLNFIGARSRSPGSSQGCNLFKLPSFCSQPVTALAGWQQRPERWRTEVLDFCTGSHKSSSFTHRKSRTSNNPVPVLRIHSKYGWMSCSLNESNLTRLRRKLQPWIQQQFFLTRSKIHRIPQELCGRDPGSTGSFNKMTIQDPGCIKIPYPGSRIFLGYWHISTKLNSFLFVC